MLRSSQTRRTHPMAAVLALALAVAATSPAAAERSSHPLEGQEAPEIELKSLGGDDFVLSESDAQVVVLDFWATWCGPCRRGLPLLQKFHDWARDNGKPVAVYAVNLQENADQVKAYWKKESFTMPVLMDQTGETAASYMVQGIPQTVIVANGSVQAVHVGFTPKMQEILEQEVEAILKKSEK